MMAVRGSSFGTMAHLLSLALMALLSAAASRGAVRAVGGGVEQFVATMFSGPSYASPSSSLLVARSSDGVTFTNIQGTNSSPHAPLYMLPGGVRDPSVLFYRGHWYVVLSYAANKTSSLFMASSPDLQHWTPLGTGGGVLLAPRSHDNYVDIPQLILDPGGGVHVIADLDGPEQWVEIHPRNSSASPDTWGDPSSWSVPVNLRDASGARLIQDNTFVTHRQGIFYMAFNGNARTPGLSPNATAGAYFMRTSRSLTKGWSAPRMLNIDPAVFGGDSESLVFLEDGRMRFYISDGNAQKHKMWCVDSTDGFAWSAPQLLRFEGFVAPGINWAQVVVVPRSYGGAKSAAVDQRQDPYHWSLHVAPAPVGLADRRGANAHEPTTLAAALARLRLHAAAYSAAVIHLQGGRYPVASALQLPRAVTLAGDSAKGVAVIDGGVPIYGWATDPTQPSIFVAALPVELAGRPVNSLWVGGQRRGPARTPTLRYKNATATGIVVGRSVAAGLPRSSTPAMRCITYQHWSTWAVEVADMATNSAGDLELTFVQMTANYTGDRQSGSRFYLENAAVLLARFRSHCHFRKTGIDPVSELWYKVAAG
jgi:hypothetical protein